MASVATHCRMTKQHNKNQTDGISPASATTAVKLTVSHDPKDSTADVEAAAVTAAEFGCDVCCSVRVQKDLVTG